MNKTNQTFPHSIYIKKQINIFFKKKNYIENLYAKTYKIFYFTKDVLISLTSKEYSKVMKELIKIISKQYFTPNIIRGSYHL